MKNKKTVYVLLPVVAIVWGVIFYKIFTGIGSDESMTTNAGTEPVYEVADTTKVHYTLFLDYSDPFLKTTSVKNISANTSSFFSATLSNTSHEKAAEKKLPELRYLGMIQHSKKNQKVALVSIDHTSHLMKTGDSHNDVTVVKIWDDSIKLRVGKKELYLRSGKTRHETF